MDAEQNSGPVTEDLTLEEAMTGLLQLYGAPLFSQFQSLAKNTGKTITLNTVFSPYNAVVDITMDFADLPKATAN